MVLDQDGSLRKAPVMPTPGKKQPPNTPPRRGDGDPIFAQPTPSPDPTSFKNPITDQKDVGIGIVEPVPQAANAVVEPVLTLAQAYGSKGATVDAAIQKAGQIVFHSVGDTGSVKGPSTQSLVADKMVTDFTESNAADVPAFLFHLGDLVYYFGESNYYYDQFFEPYRLYPAPILAIPGNHDGVVYSSDPEPTLTGFLRNFCAPSFNPSPDAGGLLRSTMIQPAVYFTFDCPLVRILGLYSNVLEDPGVISDQGGTYKVLDSRQVDFLTAALNRVKTDKFTGAVIIATHHPPFTGGSIHGGSPAMLADIDIACKAAGVWPHAIFSGHAHNYQRFTRTVDNLQIPFLVAGCGGHSPLSSMRSILRTPYKIDNTLTLENYNTTDYGYLRIVVNAQTMRIEFHTATSTGTSKTPNDSVVINLSTHTITG
jgi:hypothetical protein